MYRQQLTRGANPVNEESRTCPVPVRTGVPGCCLYISTLESPASRGPRLFDRRGSRWASRGSDIERRIRRPSRGSDDRSRCMAEDDWTAALETAGHGVIPGRLGGRECAAMAALYDDPARFRSKVVMAKHGFGRGEYQYLAHPLPERVLELRRSLYAALVQSANRWAEALGKPGRYPERLEMYLEECQPGTDAADAAAAPVRPGRLQLPPPGHLRRAGVPVPGDGAPSASRRRISAEASSCSRSSDRGCSPGWTSSRSVRETRWPSRSTSGRCRARAACTGCGCGTA